MKLISQQTFADIKANGHGVPRNEKTGEVVHLTISKNYTLKCFKTGELIRVKTTQTYPTHVKVI